jgi:site-specific recombinase XerD
MQRRSTNILDTTDAIMEDYKHFLLCGLAGRTVNRYLTGCRRFFKYCKVQGYIKHNPTLEVTYPVTGVPTEYKVLQPDIVDALFKENFGSNLYTTIRSRLIICLILRYGLSPKELCNLLLSDVDIEHKNIRVKKKNKYKFINLDNYAVAVLKHYLDERNHFIGRWRGSIDQHLICASTVRWDSFMLRSSGISAILRRILQTLRKKYGYDISGISAMTMAHTSRLYNWIVMDSISEERKEQPCFEGSMSHVSRRKLPEYFSEASTVSSEASTISSTHVCSG